MTHALYYMATYAAGVATSLLSAYLWEKYTLQRIKHHARRDDRNAVIYESRKDHLFHVNRWSAERLLTPGNLKTERNASRPPLRWVDSGTWTKFLTNRRAQTSGDCGYITGCSGVDFRESRQTDVFTVMVSTCDHAEGEATYDALASDANATKAIVDLLWSDPLAYVSSALPCPLAVNIAVLSRDGRHFLTIRRSGTVNAARNILIPGPCETMVLPERSTPGHKPEDFFSIAHRGLHEELGLEVHDYGRLAISWFGYYAPMAHPWVFAQVRLRLSDKAALERIGVGHSLEEAGEVFWLPFDRKTVRAVQEGSREGHNVRVEGGVAAGVWRYFAPHSLNELWRMRSAL